MIKQIAKILSLKLRTKREYKGFSDFLLHAPLTEKTQIMFKAAEKANEDQFRVFNQGINGVRD